MSLQLESIIPIGRTLDEYRDLFDLGDISKELSILDCGGGPSSFNAESSIEGYQVTSIDPLYTFNEDQIRKRIDETFEDMMVQAERNKDQFIWDSIPSILALREKRWGAMTKFLEDYDKGLDDKRYLAMTLPDLEFKTNQFDLALCSHLLFLYSDHLDESFHIKAIREMRRVAKEVRIFPLVDLGGIKSKHLDGIMNDLEKAGYQYKIRKVKYEFLKNANEMLVIN